MTQDDDLEEKYRASLYSHDRSQNCKITAGAITSLLEHQVRLFQGNSNKKHDKL